MRLKIGGHNVKVKIYNQFDSCVNNVGTCAPAKGIINVVKNYDGDKMCKQGFAEALLHEVCHFIDYVYCGYIFEEEVIESASKYLLYVFNKNDLFNFPESVDVMGFDYWIRYNYKFKGDTGKIHIDVNYVTHDISMSDNNDMCDNYTKLGVIVSVLKILNNEYIKSDIFEDNIPTFAQGIFQVMIDNKKFRKLFKWGE